MDDARMEELAAAFEELTDLPKVFAPRQYCEAMEKRYPGRFTRGELMAYMGR